MAPTGTTVAKTSELKLHFLPVVAVSQDNSVGGVCAAPPQSRASGPSARKFTFLRHEASASVSDRGRSVLRAWFHWFRFFVCLLVMRWPKAVFEIQVAPSQQDKASANIASFSCVAVRIKERSISRGEQGSRTHSTSLE